MVTPGAAWAFLGARVALLGVERIVLKDLARGRDAIAATTLFFGLGGIVLTLFSFNDTLPAWGSAWIWPAVAIPLYTVVFALYGLALGTGDATIVAPLYHASAVILVLLAAAFLDEPLTPLRIGGVLVVVLGATLLEARNGLPNPRALLARRDARLMLAASALLAVGRILDRRALDSFEPTSYAAINNLGIGALMLLYLAARGRAAVPARMARQRPWFCLMAGFVNGFAYLALLLAFTALDVGVAEPASALSLVITAVLAHWRWGEPLGSRLLGSLVLIVGVWLLYASV